MIMMAKLLEVIPLFWHNVMHSVQGGKAKDIHEWKVRKVRKNMNETRLRHYDKTLAMVIKSLLPYVNGLIFDPWPTLHTHLLLSLLVLFTLLAFVIHVNTSDLKWLDRLYPNSKMSRVLPSYDWVTAVGTYRLRYFHRALCFFYDLFLLLFFAFFCRIRREIECCYHSNALEVT